MKLLLNQENKHLFLMISLFSLLIIYPIFSVEFASEILIDSFIITILIFAILASAHTKINILIATFLAIAFLLIGWISQIMPVKSLMLVSSISGAAFFLYIAFILIHDIFKNNETVSLDMIYSSVSTYMLIGLAFAFIYLTFNIIHPGSFTEPMFMSKNSQSELYGFIYFSFVTLSTLGYGDVSPNILQTAAFVYMEAIIGQLYLTIIIARLVGLHISQNTIEQDCLNDTKSPKQ